jgi:hypothetical protein
MTVKLVLLKSGEKIVSDIKEGFYEDKLVCYVLEKPCSVTINGSYKILDEESPKNRVSISLSNWPPLSSDTTIELTPDWIITIVEPKIELKRLYQKQILNIEEDEPDQSISIDEQLDTDQSD